MYQDQIRNFEARDRNTAENNYERVNFWSAVHIVILMLTGIVQVIMVRSLFDEKSTLRRLWKQGKMWSSFVSCFTSQKWRQYNENNKKK